MTTPAKEIHGLPAVAYPEHGEEKANLVAIVRRRKIVELHVVLRLYEDRLQVRAHLVTTLGAQIQAGSF